MSLINEALNRARKDAATEEAGPQIEWNAVVARDTERGGLKVMSLIIGAVVILVGGIVAVLIIGQSESPQQAGAAGMAASAAIGENTALTAKNDTEAAGKSTGGEVGAVDEKEKETLQPVAANPVVTARTPLTPVVEMKTTAGPDTGPTAGPDARSVAQPSVKPGAQNDGQVTVASATPVVAQTPTVGVEPAVKSEVRPEVKPAANPAANPAAKQPVIDPTQPSPELIAAVLKVLEAKKISETIKASANTSADKSPDTSTSGKQGDTPKSNEKKVPAAPPATSNGEASPFPTFVGEVVDERFPYLKISGISRSNDQQVALINKKILLLGDMVDNVMVERIERKRVRLKHRGKVFILELP